MCATTSGGGAPRQRTERPNRFTPNIAYFGTDMAMPEPAPKLKESNILWEPVTFGNQPRGRYRCRDKAWLDDNE